MKLDTANRNFYGIIGLAAAPFLLLGLFGCGVLTVTAYRIATRGPSALGHGTVGTIAGVFLAMSALGVAMALRSLHGQWRATVRLTERLDTTRRPVPAQLQKAAVDSRLREIRVVDDPDAFDCGDVVSVYRKVRKRVKHPTSRGQKYRRSRSTPL